MNCFPDFSEHGYRVERELGANRAGGRVTYLASTIETQQKVVIKQFHFAYLQDGWSGYDTYVREIQILQELDHPGIPQYLNSFETPNGFCMVQEYKKAISLAEANSFNPFEIKRIAIAALEILVYLQQRQPSVIHRDIKPENILVDDELNVYLVDFGFARVGQGEVGVSSVVKGTLGFMPPEQLFNRQLTEASDLYSLGITLICLLTKTKSNEIGNLVDISYQIKFKHLIPKISSHWVNWLEKMVDARLQGRYPTAAAAVAVMPSCEMCLPEAVLSRSSLELTAIRVGEPLRHIVTVTNTVPDTVLDGQWEVEPHASDPPLDLGQPAWIKFDPVEFTGNRVDCQIKVDTSKLVTNQLYTRRLLLHVNASTKTYVLTLQVRTAPIPIRTKSMPYPMLGLLLLFASAMSNIVAWCMTVVGTVTNTPVTTTIGVAAGVVMGFEIAACTMAVSSYPTGAIAAAISGIGIGIVTLLKVLTGTWFETNVGTGLLFTAVAGVVGGWLLGVATGVMSEMLVERGMSKQFAIGVSLTTVAVGMTVGYGMATQWLNPMIILVAVGEGLVLATLLLRLPLKRRKQIASYRKFERHLIQP